MYCSSCGNAIQDQAVFCSACGSQTSLISQPVPPVAAPKPQGNAGNVLGVLSLVVGGFGLWASLSDAAGIFNGSFAYIYSTEEGLLLIAGILGLILGIFARKYESKLGIWGILLSSSTLLLALMLASYVAQ